MTHPEVSEKGSPQIQGDKLNDGPNGGAMPSARAAAATQSSQQAVSSKADIAIARKRRGLLIEALEGGTLYLTVRATDAEFEALREQINHRSSGACCEVKVRK